MRYGVVIPTVQARVRFMGRTVRVPKEVLVEAIKSPSQVKAIAGSAWAEGMARAFCLSPDRQTLPWEMLTEPEKKCIKAMRSALARRIVERFGIK